MDAREPKRRLFHSMVVATDVLVRKEIRIFLTRLERHYFAYGAPNLQDDLGEAVAIHPIAQGTRLKVEQIGIQTADFIAEQNAIVINPTLALGQKYARRPKVSLGKRRNHYVVILVVVPAILRDDQSDARSVRIMGLVRRLHSADLAPPRPALRHLRWAAFRTLEAALRCGSTHLLPLRILPRRRRLPLISVVLRFQSALKLLRLLRGVCGVLLFQRHDLRSSFQVSYAAVL